MKDKVLHDLRNIAQFVILLKSETDGLEDRLKNIKKLVGFVKDSCDRLYNDIEGNKEKTHG